MEYWASQWLMENNIKSRSDVDRVMSNHRALKSFRDAARNSYRHEVHRVPFENAIVAGRGIDIVGIGANTNRDTVVDETARLLRKVWHFFDIVVLEDLAPIIAESSLSRINHDGLAGWLESLLLIEQVGAGSSCMFMSSADLCKDCGSVMGHELVKSSTLNVEQRLITMFAEDTTIKLSKPVNGLTSARITSTAYSFDYQVQKESSWFEGRSEIEILRSLLWPKVGQSIDQFGMELFFANVANLGLGSSSPIESLLLKDASTIKENPANQIAFDIQIPYVEGVPLQTLYKIKREEHDSFLKYQTGLRAAIYERLKTASQDNYDHLASEIFRDEIDVPFRDLQRRLKLNSDTLSKYWSGAGVGVILAAIGFLTHDPSLMTVGTTAALGTAVAGLKPYGDRNDLKARDTYFLFEGAVNSRR